jgi:phage gp29-like protein
MVKKKQPAAKAPAASRIISDPPLSLQIGQITGSLTPRTITNILSLADLGQTYRLVDLVHDGRHKDGTLHAALSLAEQAVAQLKWQVKPPPKPSKKEKKLADAFAESFAAAEDRTVFIEHSIGERRLFGHATTEVLWAMRDAYLAPIKYKPIHCRRFGFRQSDGALVFVGNAGNSPENGVDLLSEYAPGNFVQARQRVNGDVPTREGLAQLVIWLSVGRNWGYRDWMQLAELAWKPKRIGKYKRAAQPEDIQALKKILLDLWTNGVAVHSEEVEVNLLWPQGSSTGGASGSVHKDLLIWLSGELSKAILGSSDQMEPGENGARAAVEVRSDNPKLIRDANASTLADTITRQQVVPFTRYNGGDNVRPGTFEFITDDPADLEKFSKALLNFRKAKMRVPESWVNEKANIPTPAKGERLVGDEGDGDGQPKPTENQGDSDV